MAYEKWNTGETSPIDWLVLVMDKMEFDKAFQVLDKYTHFHSSTLRGKVLMLQMRHENAFEHFDRAEEKFKKINNS